MSSFNLDDTEREDIPCVEPQEDLSGSIHSTRSELVTSSGSFKLNRQHSKSCSNIQDYTKKESHDTLGRLEDEETLTYGATIPHQPQRYRRDTELAGESGIPPHLVCESGNVPLFERSPYTSCFSSLMHSQDGRFMYTTGPITKEILKKKLVEPGNIMERVLKHTIPNVATISVSIVSCVSDSFSHNIHTMGYLNITLIGEVADNFKENLVSFKVYFRSAIKEKQSPVLCREPEEIFDFWDEGGQQIFQFKLGSPKNLKKLPSEVVVLECDVGLSPSKNYGVSLAHDFVNISIKK